jgi:hypothetical protein
MESESNLLKKTLKSSFKVSISLIDFDTALLSTLVFFLIGVFDELAPLDLHPNIIKEITTSKQILCSCWNNEKIIL